MINETVGLLNELLTFVKEKGVEENCVLDNIQDFCHDKDITLDEFIDRLEDYDAFKDYVYKDLVKHKYIKPDEVKSKNDFLDNFFKGLF